LPKQISYAPNSLSQAQFGEILIQNISGSAILAILNILATKSLSQFYYIWCGGPTVLLGSFLDTQFGSSGSYSGVGIYLCIGG